jgi:hypothetical protein
MSVRGGRSPRLKPGVKNGLLGETLAGADVFVEDGLTFVTAADGGTLKLTTDRGETRQVEAGELAAPLPLAGAWTVRFAPGWGAPASVRFDRLTSWSESPTPAIRYFSGSAVYSKKVTIPAGLLKAGRALELDLGEVRELARVKLNGQDLGVVWTVPRVVDVTSAARPGENTLEVEVTNLWPNRLIGDQTLPEAQRKTWTNIRKFTATSPLMSSGLLGPVLLRSRVRIPLE